MSASTLSHNIDLEKLLRPIKGERPTGESLRYEGVYDRIREARREDDPGLSQGIYKTDLKRANWEANEILCLEALETRSKDLQIAAWLLEAWLHLHGFVGVKEGLRLLSGLCESYWDELYPEMEGDNVESRIAPIIWINEKLSLKLKQIPVTLPQSTDAPIYCYADWESACHLDNLVKKRPDVMPAANGKVTPATFHASVSLTPGTFYVSLAVDIKEAVEACLTLNQVLDEKCGKSAPSLHLFRETLETIQNLVADILRARHDTFSPEEFQETPAGAEIAEGSEVWSNHPIRSRAEAYWRLSEAADYLLRTEPHSPTPYLVKRAVAWGSMSLLELFQQIIRNESEMQEINRLLRLAGKEK